MEMAVTVVYVDGMIDLEAGLRRLEAVTDEDLAELAPAGILGWGWSLPGEDAPPQPWSDAPELAELAPGDEVRAELVGRFAAAARISVTRCLGHVEKPLGGANRWFEDGVATRLAVEPSGVLVLCAEDVPRMGETSTFCDIVRLPADALPEVGRAMHVHGLDSVELRVRMLE